MILGNVYANPCMPTEILLIIILTNVCVPLYSAKGIDDVALYKKIKFVWLSAITRLTAHGTLVP